MDSTYHVVLVTVSSTSEAKSIAHHVEECRETLMIMKTRQDKLDELISSIKQLHSYDIPEIISVPLGKSSEDYLRWIDTSMTKPQTQNG